MHGRDHLLPLRKHGVTPVPALGGGPEDEDLRPPVLELPGIGLCGMLGLVESVGVVLDTIDDPTLPDLYPIRFWTSDHTSGCGGAAKKY